LSMAKPKTKDTARHPIGVVTERTGLSTHVLRAWERRYGVVHPARSEGGKRLYSDADVQRLALLTSATRAGRPVASVASLSTEALRRMVAEDAERASRRPTLPGLYRAQAMEAVRDLASDRLERLLRRALLSLGAVTFLEDVVAPLLVDIGAAWHDGRITIAHEHAASATLLQLLGWLVRALEAPGDAPRVAIATPRGEHHAFGAMMAAAAAAHDGWHVTWLGSDLPAAQVAAGAEQGGTRAVALSAAARTNGLDREVRTLRALLPTHLPLMVGGEGAVGLADVRGVTAVRDLSHWRALLRAHATQLPE
jgi:DNA-binding transcriptional MerR regulator/methylmalonyl-CoA mutase cobalamin-binding subunit